MEHIQIADIRRLVSRPLPRHAPSTGLPGCVKTIICLHHRDPDRRLAAGSPERQGGRKTLQGDQADAECPGSRRRRAPHHEGRSGSSGRGRTAEGGSAPRISWVVHVPQPADDGGERADPAPRPARRRTPNNSSLHHPAAAGPWPNADEEAEDVEEATRRHLRPRMPGGEHIELIAAQVIADDAGRGEPVCLFAAYRRDDEPVRTPRRSKGRACSCPGT